MHSTVTLLQFAIWFVPATKANSLFFAEAAKLVAIKIFRERDLASAERVSTFSSKNP